MKREAVKAGEQVQVRAGKKAYAYYGLQERVTGPVNRQVWTTLLDPVLRVAWEGVPALMAAQMTRGRP